MEIVRIGKNGCGQSGYEALKLSVSQEWAVKSCLNDILVGAAFLIHETLKSVVC